MAKIFNIKVKAVCFMSAIIKYYPISHSSLQIYSYRNLDVDMVVDSDADPDRFKSAVMETASKTTITKFTRTLKFSLKKY